MHPAFGEGLEMRWPRVAVNSRLGRPFEAAGMNLAWNTEIRIGGSRMRRAAVVLFVVEARLRRFVPFLVAL
jgi:hypothetical protein